VADADDLCFDPKRRRVYVVGGAGRVTVIDVGRTCAAVVDAACTGSGSRTSVLGAGTDAGIVARSSVDECGRPLNDGNSSGGGWKGGRETDAPSSPLSPSQSHSKPPPPFRCLGEVPTGLGARTGIFLPGRDRLYVAVPATATTPPRLLAFAPAD
jgi:hypothetical protein